jgi:(E)-4-hydroxy-3-methylbut-2-enyl-diphosphate synthase
MIAKRRYAVPIRVGNVVIGGTAPIAVQTMTKTDTRDVKATLRQIDEIADAGADIVRVAVPDHEAADALFEIVPKSKLPVIADIHFDHTLALRALDAGVACLRINPGNIPDPEKVKKMVQKAKEREVPIRVGVNAGSLPEEVHKSLRQELGGAPRHDRERMADRMVEVALGHIKILEDLDFRQIKISLKSTDIWVTYLANKKMAQLRPYPLHLGITESGPPASGAIKSAIGIGLLLAEGIGDTIRVSLSSEDPVEEVRVGHEILKAMQIRVESPTLIACPTCGRLEYDMVPIVREAERYIQKLKVPITVAVMGCVVNGPAEARHADIGIAGGKGKGIIFCKGQIVRTMPEEELLPALLQEIDKLAKEMAEEQVASPQS